MPNTGNEQMSSESGVSTFVAQRVEFGEMKVINGRTFSLTFFESLTFNSFIYFMTEAAGQCKFKQGPYLVQGTDFGHKLWKSTLRFKHRLHFLGHLRWFHIVVEELNFL